MLARHAAPKLDQISPMLLVAKKAMPREADRLYEIKFDGYRVLASTGSTARLKSCGGDDATAWFPSAPGARTWSSDRIEVKRPGAVPTERFKRSPYTHSGDAPLYAL
jgi:ATP-dependent DNA ligase